MSGITEFVVFFVTGASGHPVYIYIHTFFSDGDEVSLKNFSTFWRKTICDSWMKLENILNHFKSLKFDSNSVEGRLECICSLLKKCIDKVKGSVLIWPCGSGR